MRDVESRAATAAVLVVLDERGVVAGGVTYAAGGGPFAALADTEEAEIRMLAVSPEMRGRGLGSALVESCIDRARTEHRARVWLSTSPWMRAAQQLYESVGFQRVPQRDRVDISSGMALGAVGLRDRPRSGGFTTCLGRHV